MDVQRPKKKEDVLTIYPKNGAAKVEKKNAKAPEITKMEVLPEVKKKKSTVRKSKK